MENPMTDNGYGWKPTLDQHPITCECAGENLIHDYATDSHGQAYKVWRPCKRARKREVLNPGAEISCDAYAALPFRPFDPDDADHEYARMTAHAIVADPGCLPFPTHNPLAHLVAQYVTNPHPHRKSQRSAPQEGA